MIISKPKDQKFAVILALAGVVIPGLHKFYLGRPIWGIAYLLFYATTIPQIASVVEGIWYLSQRQDEFDHNFNSDLLLADLSSQTVPVDPARVEAIAQALRQLESLRQEGLISEYEFEQKRRQLLE